MHYFTEKSRVLSTTDVALILSQISRQLRFVSVQLKSSINILILFPNNITFFFSFCLLKEK